MASTRSCSKWAERVALLSVLSGEVPHPPTRYREPHQVDQDNTTSRTLSFREEKQLTQELAFLSGITDDASRITAVCVEESRLHHGHGLKVVIAINRDSPTARQNHLEKIKASLRCVFSDLSYVSDKTGHRRADDMVLNSIVSMCRSRIMSRLRFFKIKSSASRQRRSLFLGSMPSVLEALPGLDEEQTRTIARAKRLGEAFSKFESTPSTQDLHPLVDLIKRVYESRSVIDDLKPLLIRVQRHSLSPCSVDETSQRLHKIARYLFTAQLFCKLARRHPQLFRKVEIVLINPGLSAFKFDQPHRSTNNDLTATLESRGVTKRESESFLKKPRASEDEVQSMFRSIRRKILKAQEIHAEVQLVAHYHDLKNDSDRLLPRVICASKDTCYLCNAFIQAYDGFYIPATHGELYPRWRLPASVDWGGVVGKLDRKVNEDIQEWIEKVRLYATGELEPLHMSYPNTSTINLVRSTSGVALDSGANKLRTPTASERSNPRSAGNPGQGDGRNVRGSKASKVPQLGSEVDVRSLPATSGRSNSGFSPLLSSSRTSTQQGTGQTKPRQFEDRPGSCGVLMGFGSGFGGSMTTTGFGATAKNPGISINIGDPPGTHQTEFRAFVEKEPNNFSAQNSFQNILFQDPYKKWSSEELRLVDYNQGRRYGNSGDTGAFGVSSCSGKTYATSTRSNLNVSSLSSNPVLLEGKRIGRSEVSIAPPPARAWSNPRARSPVSSKEVLASDHSLVSRPGRSKSSRQSYHCSRGIEMFFEYGQAGPGKTATLTEPGPNVLVEALRDSDLKGGVTFTRPGKRESRLTVDVRSLSTAETLVVPRDCLQLTGGKLQLTDGKETLQISFEHVENSGQDPMPG